MPRRPIGFQLSSKVACSAGNSQVRIVGRPNIVQPQRAVGLDDGAVRAHPAGMAAAAGEIPAAGDAIAARHRDRLAVVGRAPGAGRARIAEHLARGVEAEIRREQPDAVGDRHAPADRAVGSGQFPDRQHIVAGLDLVAADRARIEHAKQPGFVQPLEHLLGDPPGALGRVGRGGDHVRQTPRPRHRAGSLHIIHKAPRASSVRRNSGVPDGRCQ